MTFEEHSACSTLILELTADDATNKIIDLSDLKFIDSAGLGLFFAFLQTAKYRKCYRSRVSTNSFHSSEHSGQVVEFQSSKAYHQASKMELHPATHQALVLAGPVRSCFMTAVCIGIELAAVASAIALHKPILQDSNSAPAMQTDHLAVFAGKIDAKIYPVVTAHPNDALVEVTDAVGVAALCPCSRRTCPTRYHAEPYIEDSKRIDECRTLLRFNEP